ncbi:hypothetical protein OIU83_00785 [Flavobacterium sp. LS1R49]|uniref:PIN domain-containing protein n=1 Tax=Flavobacterium shii TaxID=2987687 RepID=A0A9X3BWV9_9FLAO|nr:hypothetical protein [Flavobacterium shii]MCV9926170.1 hypothetical protein [Flavobacterium shii]
MELNNVNLGNIDSGGGGVHLGNSITNVFEGLSFLLTEYKQQLEEINNLILSFKPKTALHLLNGLEDRIKNGQAEIDNKIKSKLLYLKALCKSDLAEYSKEDSGKDFIQAYLLNNQDETLKERACVEYLNLKDNVKAIKLSDEIIQIDEYNISAWFVKVLTSDDIKNYLKSVPEIVFDNYGFQQSVIYQIVRIENSDFFENLKEYGFELNIDFERYKEVTFDNKTSWLIVIDLALTKIFNKYPTKYIAGERFLLEEIPELVLTISLAEIFVNTLDKTEISNTISHQKFYYYYLSYVQTYNDNDFENINKAFQELQKNFWFYTYFMCQILNHRKEYEKTLALLDDYESLNGELNSEYFLFKSVVFHLLGKDDEVEKLFDQYLQSIDVLNERHILNIDNAFFSVQTKNYDKELYNRELEKVLKKDFSFDELKVFFEILIKVIYIKEYDSEEIYERIIQIKDCNLFDANCKNVIANNLDLIGKVKEAINYMETYIDKSKISVSLRLYIILLHKQLHDKNDEERGRYKELLELLKFWRENNSYIDELLLGFEHNFYFEIDDVNNLEEIDKLLCKEFPNNEQYLFFYLATLERKKSFDKINEICTDIKTVFDDEAIGLNISHIMIRNNIKISKGFEILYNLAFDINNTNARKNYFTASLLLKDFFEQYEEVALGYWVAYSVNGKIEKKKITSAGGLNKKFIGKKKGESFSTKSPMSNNLNTIVIIEIYNDAMKLFRDISEEANNPINELGFESLQIPQDAEEMKKFLIEQFGISGTQEKERVDNFLNEYYDYKVGFTEIVRGVFRENHINAYSHLTSIRGCKYTTIPIAFSQKITSSHELEFILDFSTLLLLFSLERDMDFKFKHKFKISYLIKKEIEDELLELKNSPESSMSIEITTEGITRYDIPENYKEKRAEFINSILVWIDKNCEIDFVEEKLDLVPKLRQNEIGFDSNFMKILVDYLHLSMRENHKLISSDSTLFLFKRNANLRGNIVNPEKYLITFYPEKCNTEFYRFLLKSNYLGIDINLETLKNEFFDFITGRENYYLLVLENLQYSVNRNPNIIIVCINFLKYLYLSNTITVKDKNRYSSELFRNTFYGMPIDLINQYENILKKEFKLLGDYYEEVLSEFYAVKNLYFK